MCLNVFLNHLAPKSRVCDDSVGVYIYIYIWSMMKNIFMTSMYPHRSGTVSTSAKHHGQRVRIGLCSRPVGFHRTISWERTTGELNVPPSYQELVKRSTQFTTSIPASIVLTQIETILSSNPSPLPYPYRNVPQRVVVDWATFQLDVCYGSLLTCTVRVFLLQRGMYIVDFRRGQLEIFKFKRFYETIRSQLVDYMRHDSALESI